VGIRPPVPPDDDGGDTDSVARRETGAPANGAGRHAAPAGPVEAGDDEAGDDEAGDDEDGADDLADFDPTVPPADLTPDELHADPPEPGAAMLEWRVDKRLTWIKLVLAVLFLAGPWLVLSSAPSRFVGLVAGAGLAVWGLRDMMAPVRLRADSAGVRVVSGYAGHRDLRWQDLERVRLDRRARLGIRSELLEIDAGESLHFFSRYDLGESPVDALERIRDLRGVGRR
jgi:hypothetical protein